MNTKRVPASILSLKHHYLGTAELGLRANASPIQKRDGKASEKSKGPDIMMYADKCTFSSSGSTFLRSWHSVGSKRPAKGHRDPINEELWEP